MSQVVTIRMSCFSTGWSSLNVLGRLNAGASSLISKPWVAHDVAPD